MLILIDGVRAPDAYSFGAQSSAAATTSISGWSSRSRSCAGRPRRSMAATASPARSASSPRTRRLFADGNWAVGRTRPTPPRTRVAQAIVGAGPLRRLEGLVAYPRATARSRKQGHERLGQHQPHDAESGRQQLERSAHQGRLFELSDWNRLRLTCEHRRPGRRQDHAGRNRRAAADRDQHARLSASDDSSAIASPRPSHTETASLRGAAAAYWQEPRRDKFRRGPQHRGRPHPRRDLRHRRTRHEPADS